QAPPRASRLRLRPPPRRKSSSAEARPASAAPAVWYTRPRCLAPRVETWNRNRWGPSESRSLPIRRASRRNSWRRSDLLWPVRSNRRRLGDAFRCATWREYTAIRGGRKASTPRGVRACRARTQVAPEAYRAAKAVDLRASALRVAVSVWVSDSRGMLETSPLSSQPRPGG